MQTTYFCNGLTAYLPMHLDKDRRVVDGLSVAIPYGSLHDVVARLRLRRCRPSSSSSSSFTASAVQRGMRQTADASRRGRLGFFVERNQVEMVGSVAIVFQRR